MPDIREVALGIKQWALSNRMMGDYPLVPDADMGLIRGVFGRVGLPAAINILQKRGISYVGINEILDEVIVFTNKKLTVREYDLFRNVSIGAGQDHINITFMEGGVAQVGNPPAAPAGVSVLHEHNGRFACGGSIYMGSEKGAGTLGCLVRDEDGKMYGLSNNHVTGGSNYAVPGLPIVAPGPHDVAAGVPDPETIGHHYKAYPFIDGIPDVVDAENNLDAALFEVLDPDRLSSMQRDRFDTPANSADLENGLTVEKVGRTTGYTRGTVIAELFDYEPIHYVLDVIGGRKIVYFKSLFVIKGNQDQFSAFGDSGSLIVSVDADKNRSSVGIVVGATKEELTLALSINRILNYFDVQLHSGHNI